MMSSLQEEKTMKLLIALSILVLAACGGGGGGGDSPPTGTVSVQCVTVSNNSAADCKATTMGALTTSSGNVSKAQAMFVSGVFANGTASTFVGYHEIAMAPGCNGESEKVVVFGNFTLDAGKSIDNFLSVQCGTMPVGPAEIRAVVYSGEGKRTCVHPPGTICTPTPTGEICDQVGEDICTTQKGPELDRATAQYVVVN